MFFLRTLGGVSVDPGDVVPTGAARQRMPLALLAILAASGRQGISRDRLAALLWPESDTQRARALVKQTCYALRRDLDAPELFLGAVQLRLNPAAIQSDLQQLLDALDKRDWARAVSAYGGRFLDGFYVNDAGEFERWAEETRTSLERRVSQALEALARDAEAAHDVRAAMGWWQKLATLEPLSARAVIGVMQAYVAIGDRTAALELGRRHEKLVRDELGTAPDASVTELLAGLRNASSAVHGTATAPAATDPRERQHNFTVMRARVAMASAAVLLIATVVAYGIVRANSAPTSLEPAVLPFSYAGDSAHAYLRERVPRMLGVALQELNARRLSGSVVAYGGGLRVVARFVDSPRLDPVTIDGSESDLLRLTDRVAIALVSQLLRGPDAARQRVAAGSTASLAAFKAYLRGDSAVHRGEFAEALLSYQRAVEMDSSFALAHHRVAFLALDLTPTSEWDLSVREAAAALRHASRLPPREQLRVQALAARTRGDLRTFTHYRDLVNRGLEDFDGLREYADLLASQAHAVGRSAWDSREWLERAYTIDSTDVLTRFSLSVVATAMGDYARGSHVARGVGGADDPWYAAVPSMLLRLQRPDTARDQALRELTTMQMNAAKWTAMNFIVSDADAALKERVLATVANRSDAPFEVLASWIRADQHVLFGRWRAADAELERLRGRDADRGYLVRSVFLGSGAYPVDTPTVVALRRAVKEWKAAPDEPDTDPRRHTEANVRSILKVYVIGLLDSWLGHHDSALRAADALDSRGRSEIEYGLRFRLAAELRARVLRAQGDAAGALTLLEGTDAAPWHPLFHPGWSYSPALDLSSARWLRAELLAEVGRDREALGWYDGFLDNLSNTSFFVPAAQLRTAQIYARMGERAEARARARKLVTMWKEPDSLWRPMLDRAIALAR